MSRYHRQQIKKPEKPKLVDKATYVVAILEPLVTLPQVVTIFTNKTAAGVSLTTWVGYELLTLVWIWYALAHKDRLILLYQGLFLIIQTGVIIGGLMYGARW